jgi:putative DNA primase/helicase
VGTWTTVLISSGEAPIDSFGEHGGTLPRVLTIWGSPFGATDAATAEVVRAIGDGVRANYGHLGPRFVRYLVEHRDRWPLWRTRYKELLAMYTAQAAGNAVAGRVAGHFAALELTASLVMEAFDGLCWMSEAQFDALWAELAASAPGADPVRRALHHAFAWATGHQSEFFGRHDTHDGHHHSPHGGWAGRWDASPHWAYLGFLPDRLKEVLTAGGFEFEPTILNWHDRGWLLTSCGSKTRYRAQIGGEVTHLAWLVAVRHEAIAGLDAGESA